VYLRFDRVRIDVAAASGNVIGIGLAESDAYPNNVTVGSVRAADGDACPSAGDSAGGGCSTCVAVDSVNRDRRKHHFDGTESIGSG
jgi:hypothetical protein